LEQAPRQQFEFLGFDVKIVEKFGARVKAILNGFSAPIENMDIEAFRNALDEASAKATIQTLSALQDVRGSK
jgi:hypothetical protein